MVSAIRRANRDIVQYRQFTEPWTPAFDTVTTCNLPSNHFDA